MQGTLQFQDSGFVVSHQGLAMRVLEGCTLCWEPAPALAHQGGRGDHLLC